MNEKRTNLLLIVIGGVVLQMCLGAIYTWSLFNQPLMDKFGWNKSDVVLTFSIAIFVFAVSAIFSGRLQDKIGPRIVATIGGILYGGGLILTSKMTTLFGLYLSYGVIAGAGVGFAYVCPISTLVKWFPNKKGFITGITVGAFGIGGMVFKSVIVYLLAKEGVMGAFFYLGLTYMILVVIGAQFLKVPEGFHTAKVSITAGDFSVGQMLRKKNFYILWIMYLLGCMSGLLVIGLAKDIGIQLAGLSPLVAANAVVLIALFNAGGRLILATLSDKFGRMNVVLFMFALTAISMLVMSLVQLNFFIFFACLAGIAFCFGGFLAIFPAITGDFFGLKYIGSNYGLVFQAYGIAALVGPLIVASAGSLKTTFLISAVLALVGGVMTLNMKKRQNSPTT
jgi:OFA family oxalate/formate antiporter-like MFS transporter